MRLVFAILFSLSLAPALGQTSAPAKPDRVALVIGNANYQDADSPLKDPVKDVRALASELLRMGFDVDVGENLSKDAMRRAFDRLNALIGRKRLHAAAVKELSLHGSSLEHPSLRRVELVEPCRQ